MKGKEGQRKNIKHKISKKLVIKKQKQEGIERSNLTWNKNMKIDTKKRNNALKNHNNNSNPNANNIFNQENLKNTLQMTLKKIERLAHQ